MARRPRLFCGSFRPGSEPAVVSEAEFLSAIAQDFADAECGRSEARFMGAEDFDANLSCAREEAMIDQDDEVTQASQEDKPNETHSIAAGPFVELASEFDEAMLRDELEALRTERDELLKAQRQWGTQKTEQTALLTDLEALSTEREGLLQAQRQWAAREAELIGEAERWKARFDREHGVSARLQAKLETMERAHAELGTLLDLERSDFAATLAQLEEAYTNEISQAATATVAAVSQQE